MKKMIKKLFKKEYKPSYTIMESKVAEGDYLFCTNTSCLNKQKVHDSFIGSKRGKANTFSCGKCKKIDTLVGRNKERGNA